MIKRVKHCDQAQPLRPRKRLPVTDSLVNRLSRITLTILTLSMLLTFAVIASASWVSARQRQIESAQLSAQILANSIAPMLVFDDVSAARMELLGFSQRSDLLEIRILTPEGKIFSSWQSPKHSNKEEESTVANTSLLNLKTKYFSNEIHVQVPIKLKAEIVGKLIVHESLDGLWNLALSLLLSASVLLFIAIVLAAISLRYVQRKALLPIIELSALAEKVAIEHNYSYRAKIHRADEVGRLSDRFNEMLKRIEIWQADLHQQLKQEHLAGQEFQQLAHRDSLTQLPNRLFFQNDLHRRVAHSAQTGELMALMFIDLDNFKPINDTYGHDAGDEILRVVARRMLGVLRTSDVVCRLGGDEFAVMLSDFPEPLIAEQLAERLIASVREPITIQGILMSVGATIGLAFCPIDAREAGNLLNLSDHAMYAAKKEGKNTFRRASA